MMIALSQTNMIGSLLLTQYGLQIYCKDLLLFVVLSALIFCSIGIITLCISWIFHPYFMPLDKVKSFEVFRAKLVAISLLFGWYLFYLFSRLLAYVPLVVSNITNYVGFTMFILLFIIAVGWFVIHGIKSEYRAAADRIYSNEHPLERIDIIKAMFDGKQDFMFTIIQILFWVILPCTIFAQLYKIICHKGVVDTLVLFISIASLLTTVFALWSSVKDKRDISVLGEKLKNAEIVGKKDKKILVELDSDDRKQNYDEK